MISLLGESAIVAVSAVFASQVVRIYRQRKRILTDFDYAMSVVAGEAVKQARREYDVDLDFSAESVERVEAILAKMHDAHQKTALSEKELALLSLRWGAYVGEVLKRVRPGKWQRDSEKMGPGATPVVFEPGTEAYPRSWVYKRLADGPEDNVQFKFEVFSNPRLREQLGGPQQPAN